uniref:Pumilio n=1 Tax=Anopheles merus TaxID=30066 RepID=A0A182UX22_ANOME
MKLLGGHDDGGGRNAAPIRTQDDAAVGYVFQRHPNETEFNQFAQKQSRWASGDDTIIDMPMQGGMYDHLHPPNVNVNGVGVPKPPMPEQQLVYLSGSQQYGTVLAPQNQYIPRNNSAINTSTAKKLWEKGGSNDVKVAAAATGPLPPLQLHGTTDHPVWRDSTWSSQGDAILAAPRRIFQHGAESNPTGSTGILSPRDSTGGLGVKMVEYVLGGSPTNKESPLASLDSRFKGLKFDDGDKASDDKDKANSPFETNGVKKEEVVPGTNGVVMVNGIDDDKGFNRTPGSRQPSPAEEQLPRPNMLDPTGVHGSGFPQHPSLHNMLGSAAPGGNDVTQQAAAAALGSYHPQMINQMGQMGQLGQMNPMNQLNQLNQLNQMQSHVMNGVGGIPQIAQVKY